MLPEKCLTLTLKVCLRLAEILLFIANNAMLFKVKQWTDDENKAATSLCDGKNCSNNMPKVWLLTQFMQ